MNKRITVNKTIEKLSKIPKPENMSEQDKKLYSEVGLALLENELELFIVNKQWVLGIIVMASILNFVGKTKLIWHHKGLVSTKKIMKYDFARTIKDLQKFNIIDNQIYNKLEEIRKIRNSFAHDLLRQWSISLKPNPNLENLIRDGIAIITTLF